MDCYKISESMKKYIAGLSQRNVSLELEFFRSLLAQYKLKVSLETYETKVDENATDKEKLNDINYYDKHRSIHQDDNTVEFDYSHLTERDIGVRRIIVTGSKQNINTTNTYDINDKITLQANGLIYDTATWDILCVPSELLTFNYKNNKVIDNMDNYDIYEIQDGTTINLYYFAGKWTISSANGYEINDFKWFGNKTFETIFNELLTKLYPKFSFDSLDKNNCYTFGFRTNEYHPLLTDPNNIWLICEYDLKTGQQCNTTNLMGIKAQEPITFKDNGKKLFNILCNNNDGALSKYVKDPKKDNIHYGYILRHKNGTEFKLVPNIIMESSLFKMIRSSVYNFPKNTKTLNITAENRMNFICLRSYLDNMSNDRKKCFIKLFPQYTDNYKKYDEFIDKLVNKIKTLYRKKSDAKSIYNKKLSEFDALAITFKNLIRKQYNVSCNDENLRSIIKDYVDNKKNLEIFYNYLYRE
jgi:hypothetical protein